QLEALDGARAAAVPVTPDEDHEGELDGEEDNPREAEDHVVRGVRVVDVRRVCELRGEAAVRGCGDAGRREGESGGGQRNEKSPPHGTGILFGMPERSRVDVPAYVPERYDVYVGGVKQERGVDYEVLGRSLVFARPIAQE